MSTTSTNMGLQIPTVGTETGPNWAAELNQSLTIVDAHNHATGNGVQIQPAGLNISSDLTFLSNNATTLRSARFSAQVSPLGGTAPDLGCVYVAGNELYYNDLTGAQVKLTNNGSVAGTSGSIGNLTSPASVNYVSANTTYVFQSAASTPGSLDGGSLTLRKISASSPGITLSAPSALSSNYSITLPATTPTTQSFLTMDSSGNVSAPISLANGITRSNLAPVGQQVASSSGAYTTSSTSFTQVTNQSVTITTTGRPIMIMVAPVPNGSGDTYIGVTGTGVALNATFRIINATTGDWWTTHISDSVTTGPYLLSSQMPPGVLNTIDFKTAGTYTYTLNMLVASGSYTGYCQYVNLVVYEL